MAYDQALLLGALLHDIGKFEFRTSERGAAHTTYGDYFVTEYLSRYGCLKPVLERVRRLVSHHHDGEAADAFLREADGLAASERVDDGSRQTRRSLVSVLAAIDVGRGPVPEGVFRYVPGPLTIDGPFPAAVVPGSVQKWRPDERQMADEHREAWQLFSADMARLPDTTVRAWTDTFLAVARKHLTRVTSAAFRAHPDISLYDHLRSVAAIAMCLEQAGDQPQPFLLLHGDISGIQAFLYRVAAPDEADAGRGMARRLRGRSLYVALLAESVARYYLRQLDLPRVNLLYAGGGHFLALVPNTAAYRERVAAAETVVNGWLLRQHGGDLAIVCARTPADREQLTDFPGLMARSGTALGEAKRRKFSGLLGQGIFAPQRLEGPQDVCRVCQADYPQGAGAVCPDCQRQAELGRQLLGARYLVCVEAPEVTGDDGVSFGALGIGWRLAGDPLALAAALRHVPASGETRVDVECLNDTAFLPPAMGASGSGAVTSYGFRFLANHAPEDAGDGGPLDFEQLARQGTEHYPMLGVVRMDVDALGAVFAQGLGRDRSLSRVVTLSRELDGFFSGYVNVLARAHSMYVTYSGGDDLFVVGSWIHALQFSRALRRDFGRFACGNPNLTLSGGILFSRPGFPIGRAAEVAGDLEHAAKGLDAATPQRGKDAVALFGEVVHWSRLEELMTYGDDLLSLLGHEDPNLSLPRSFVHRLLALGQERKAAEAAGDVRGVVRTQMRLRYLVARRGATRSALQGQPGSARLAVLGRLVTDPDLMQHIAVPTSYALYQTRRLNQEDRPNHE
jgi:CRISPR-associated protein Csm1